MDITTSLRAKEQHHSILGYYLMRPGLNRSQYFIVTVIHNLIHTHYRKGTKKT